MSMFGRMNTIFQAKMSKVLDKAENPNETLDYSYQKQLQLLQNVQRGLADLVTSKRRLQLQHDQLQANLQKLDDQAREALGSNREDLARLALQRKVGVQQQLQGLDTQIAQLETQQEKLTDAEQRLRTKIETFRTQKETLKAEYTASEAQVKINEAATGISEEMADVGLAIDRAQDKTQQMQARAAALDDLVATGALTDFTAGGQDDIDRQLTQLSTGNDVDTQLAAMKAQLGHTDQKQLEASQ
ncbi:MAG TPA: PspA/IM30 family protein [Chloroflexota bacterium]|nr:PspA/IM30 family protein [Chloroflexota bacterium]